MVSDSVVPAIISACVSGVTLLIFGVIWFCTGGFRCNDEMRETVASTVNDFGQSINTIAQGDSQQGNDTSYNVYMNPTYSYASY